jgi:sterol desaturase/sphingolipid hydroxylase (fatty acid hydroxylase superfamily)
MDFTRINLIHYAIPGFILLILVELVFSAIAKRELYATVDTFSSLAMGIGNVLTGLVSKSLVLLCFYGAYEFRLLNLGWTWPIWVIAFFAEDFCYYWFHRVSHAVGWFWASHVVHHSSTHYNLSTALRQTWTGNFTGAFVFWIWMPFIGFHPLMVMTLQSISLLYQFWIHTEAVQRLPAAFEFVFNTPSHHRVHHGSDLKYLDKNHAGILIIWDRLFGTFKKEEDRPVYGLTKNLDTNNPFKIAFLTWADLFDKARKSGNFKNGAGYFFHPPGWSHDGSTKTAAQMKDDFNRLHPHSPIH